MYIASSICFCILFLCILAKASSQEEDDTGLLWKWLSFMVSRSGIYLFGVFFVIFSFLATAFKNKVGTAPWDQSRLTHGFNTVGISGIDDDDIGSIKSRLREAEVTVIALKAELEETQRTKINLENSLEELERDRSISEDQLLKTKMEGAIELDALKKENSTLEQQLERARNQVNGLNRQLDTLRREVRISEAALRDQQSLTERLESTRSELETIKSQYKSMKIERDTAVRLASEQICIASGKSLRKRQIIEEMIDAELKKMMQEDGRAHRNLDLMSSPPTINCDSDGRIEEETSNFSPSDVHTHRNAIGDAPLANNPHCQDETYNLTSETSTYSNVDRTGSTSDDCSEDEHDSNRIVTGSSAFRTFLRANYGR